MRMWLQVRRNPWRRAHGGRGLTVGAQWSAQTDYIMSEFGLHYFFAALFVLYNLVRGGAARAREGAAEGGGRR